MTKDNSANEEKKKSENVLRAYKERLKFLKQARQYSAGGDTAKAVEKYSTYLYALASYYGVTEDKLSPTFFDNEKEISELLLISHAYWDLAKAYDRSPNLHNESIRCLEQFIKFTVGFKFQHINAQMLRKLIKRKQAHNLKAFQNAYTKIQVNSKGCFIASYSYGVEHDVTNELRNFKKLILRYPFGFKFVETYYRTSPYVVNALETLGITGRVINKILIRPSLLLISKTTRYL